MLDTWCFHILGEQRRRCLKTGDLDLENTRTECVQWIFYSLQWIAYKRLTLKRKNGELTHCPREKLYLARYPSTPPVPPQSKYQSITSSNSTQYSSLLSSPHRTARKAPALPPQDPNHTNNAPPNRESRQLTHARTHAKNLPHPSPTSHALLSPSPKKANPFPFPCKTERTYIHTYK